MATGGGGGSGGSGGGGLPGNMLGGQPLVDPRALYHDCISQGLPVSPWWGKANVFTTRAGEAAGTGAVLMRSDKLALLNRTADHDLVFVDSFEQVTAKRLTITRATCVVPSAPSVSERVYLVELADRRIHLARVPINKAYNLRAPGSGLLLTSTQNPSTTAPWTWAQLVSDLWTAVGGLGTFPGLLFTPDGTPEGFDFYGGWAWSALNSVLNRIACVADYNPSTDTFTIVRIGTASSAESAALTRLSTKVLTWDGDPSDGLRADRPEKVRVLFRRASVSMGGTSLYPVDVTLAAASGVVSGTYVQLQDDLVAQGPGNAAPTNLAALTTRATERAADWLRKYQNRDRRFLKQYRDLRADVGEAVGATMTESTWEDRAEGLRSELASGPDALLERWRSVTIVQGGEQFAQQNLATFQSGQDWQTFGIITVPGVYLLEAAGFASTPAANLGQYLTTPSYNPGAAPDIERIDEEQVFAQISIVLPSVLYGFQDVPTSDATKYYSEAFLVAKPEIFTTIALVAIDAGYPGLMAYRVTTRRTGSFGAYFKRWLLVKTTTSTDTLSVRLLTSPSATFPSIVPAVATGRLPAWTLTRLPNTWYRNYLNQAGLWTPFS